nr:MAG TPA: hypothetical protein [Caudoviricetes sp.]
MYNRQCFFIIFICHFTHFFNIAIYFLKIVGGYYFGSNC